MDHLDGVYYFGRVELTGDLHLLTYDEYLDTDATEGWRCEAETLEDACALARQHFAGPLRRSEMDDLKKRAYQLLNGDRS